MAPLNHVRVGGTFIFLGIKIGSVKAGVHYETELDSTVVANNGQRTLQIKDGIQSEVVVVKMLRLQSQLHYAESTLVS